MIPAALAELIDCCLTTSRIPWWTQGAGSNVSVKDADTLWIKASGKRLDEVGADTGVASLQLAALRQRLLPLLSAHLSPEEADATYRAALLACRDPASATPSMETAMHALLPGRDVLHLHALSAVTLAEQARTDPAAVDALMRRHGLVWALVPATLPGWALAQAVAACGPADVILLANHGLILQGQAPALLATWRALEDHLLATWGGLARDIMRCQALTDPWLFMPVRWFSSTPDVAVFANQIEAITRPAGDGMRALQDDGPAVDRNAAELWAAHVALCHLAPTLPALPPTFVQRVAALPQEKLRHAQIAMDTGGLA